MKKLRLFWLLTEKCYITAKYVIPTLKNLKKSVSNILLNLKNNDHKTHLLLIFLTSNKQTNLCIFSTVKACLSLTEETIVQLECLNFTIKPITLLMLTILWTKSCKNLFLWFRFKFCLKLISLGFSLVH